MLARLFLSAVALSLGAQVAYASASGSQASLADPTLLTKPYVAPWASLPDTPELPTPLTTTYVTRDAEVKIWTATFGMPLDDALTAGITPVLFLHGGFANSDYFGHQISALAAVPDTSIIAIDSRGHGRSSTGSDPITYDLMTDDVIAVLDQYNVSKVAVVGWSDGAIIGFDLAMNYTSRVGRLFSFGGTYSPANINTTIGDSVTFNAYLARTEVEYDAINPDGNWTAFSEKMNDMWNTEPVWDEDSFKTIPSLYEDGPLVWIVDGDSEEAVNRTVPPILHEWVCFPLCGSESTLAVY